MNFFFIANNILFGEVGGGDRELDVKMLTSQIKDRRLNR